jgi:hypothetical protein
MTMQDFEELDLLDIEEVAEVLAFCWCRPRLGSEKRDFPEVVSLLSIFNERYTL